MENSMPGISNLISSGFIDSKLSEISTHTSQFALNKFPISPIDIKNKYGYGTRK